MGVFVVRQSDGQLLNGAECIVRFAVFLVLLLVVPFGLLAAAAARVDPQGQAWHDQAVGSVVIQRI